MMDSRGTLRSQKSASIQERRKKADWVTKMATAMSVVSWVFAFVVWIVLDMAAPERENFFTRLLSVEVRSYWDERLLPVAFALLVASLCTCILAFIFNVLRNRRKTDKYRKSIFIIGVITISGIVFFLSRFGGILF